MSQSQIGKTLYSRYQVTHSLGSGGFGDTYLAVDLGLPGQPKCVVKHLRPKDPNPAILPIAKSLFEREAQTLYQLGSNSDQIPRLFAHFEENGEFYLVQEFVDGHDLTQELSPGLPKSENVVFKLMKDILEVLAFVHQHNVIHRDIKPQNLMRRHRDGKIVLIDFGAVKEIGTLTVNTQGQTSVTVAIGSPGYMPSEQARGRPKLCSDVYAVGMIGIQALTGLRPEQLTEDPSTGEIVWQGLVQVNPRLANVIDTMVRDHFSQRYQSATEAFEALKSAVESPPIPPTVSSFVRSLPPQNFAPQENPLPNQSSSPSSPAPKVPWLVLAGLGILGGLGIIATVLNRSQPSQAPTSAPTSSTNTPIQIPVPTHTIPINTPTPAPTSHISVPKIQTNPPSTSTPKPTNTSVKEDSSNRVGLYEGKALNTTAGQTGNLSFNIISIDPSSGKAKVRVIASRGLVGEGELYGIINEQGIANLSGLLSYTVPNSNTNIFWDMDVNFKFLNWHQIKGTYRLYPRAGNPTGTQDGEFTATKAS